MDYIERFTPGRDDPRTATEHFVRYFACAKLAQGKRVLDAASGSGYGTAILARNATRASGLDVSPDAVRSARSEHQAENLEYVVGSVAAMPFEDNVFDLAVSFETVEHVSGSAQREFFSEVHRVLTPAGLFVVSTPDKHLAGQTNPYHEHELDQSEFLSLIEGRFSNVDLYFENVWEYAEILRAGETVSAAAVHMHAPPSDGTYMIAVCSNGADLPPIHTLLRSATCDTAALYEQSFSWRITKPLRQVKAVLGRSRLGR